MVYNVSVDFICYRLDRTTVNWISHAMAENSHSGLLSVVELSFPSLILNVSFLSVYLLLNQQKVLHHES